MSVNRISSFNLPHRPMFSAIYGSGVDDVFIDSDLRRCNLYQMLYRDFKSYGYTVVFYSADRDYNLFSYGEDDLAIFFRLKNKKISNLAPVRQLRHIAQINSPFGSFRRNRETTMQVSNDELTAKATTSDELISHYEQIQISEMMTTKDAFYRIKVTVDIFDSIIKFARQEKNCKLAVVFTTASHDIYDDSKQTIARLTNLKNDYTTLALQIKLVAIYNSPAMESLMEAEGAFFLEKFFKDIIMPEKKDEKKSQKKELPASYYLGQPLTDEVENLLNRKRLLDGVSNTMHPIEFHCVSKRLAQELAQSDQFLKGLDNLSKEDMQKYIAKIDTEKAIDQLTRLQGIDNIISQFAQYRDALRAYRQGVGGARFRPHMALMGSPGTGKTTVARLFGRILSEDGLLPLGHFIKVENASELIGEYIGSTRPKTHAVCERAKGGVLFIDEAYGLISGKNEHGGVDYGKEAIEVLIQFMENNDDSLVIFAGYTDEMTELIDKGNQGFHRRFNDLGFFYFQDYSPEVLYDISIKMITVEYTGAFATALKNIVKLKHAYRNKKFGNVGDMENLVALIVSSYHQSGDNTPLDVKHLPHDLRLLVDPDMLNETEVLAKLNVLVGQDDVKRLVRRLYNNALAERRKIVNIPGYNPELKRMNFIFSGNPGTGKTTIAQIICDVLQEIGVLQSDNPQSIEPIMGNDLLTATPADIKDYFNKAIGRALFIDEAYQLREQPRVVADIVGNITSKDYQNKMCLILAGYTYDMQQLLNVNAGMARRFETIFFKDYTNEELLTILTRLVDNDKQVRMNIQSCRSLALSYFDSITRDKNFGNADIVVQLLKTLKANRDLRYNRTPELMADMDFAYRILPEDFPNYAEVVNGDEEGDSSVTNSQQHSIVTQVSNTIQPIIIGNENGEFVVKGNADFVHAVGLLEGKNGMGTAFIFSIKKKLIITASHVIENDTDFYFIMHEGNYRAVASVIWNDHTIDMAILQLASLPEDACCFILDSEVNKVPETLEEIIHCGYIRGTNISKNFNTYSDKISNYERGKEIWDRHFDTIMSPINAAEGCSGGPVFRSRDMAVIGVLQGGFVEGGTRVITDIHQLFNNNIIKIYER